MIRAQDPHTHEQLVLLASASLHRRLAFSDLSEEEAEQAYDREMDRVRAMDNETLSRLLIEELTPDEIEARA